MDDWSELQKWAVYAISGVIGWFVRMLWTSVKELRADLKTIELHIAENYTKREDFKQAIGELKNEFKEMSVPIFRKLDKIEDYLLNHLKDK